MATRTKKYVSEHKDLDHLLQIIEDEMGPDAQLEVTEYRQGGLLGLGGKRMIEITATVQVHLGGVGRSAKRTIRLGDDWTKTPPSQHEAGEGVNRPDVAAGAPLQSARPRTEATADREESPFAGRVPVGGNMGMPKTPTHVPPTSAESEPVKQTEIVEPATAEASAPAEMAAPAPSTDVSREGTTEAPMGARRHELRPAEASPFVSVKPKRVGAKTPAARALSKPVAAAPTPPPTQPPAPAVASIESPEVEPVEAPAAAAPVDTTPVEISKNPGAPEPVNSEHIAAEALASMAAAQEQELAAPEPQQEPEPQAEPETGQAFASASQPAEPQFDLETMLEQMQSAPADLSDLQTNLDQIRSSLESLIEAEQPARPSAAPAPDAQPATVASSISLELSAVQREAYDQLVDWNIRSADALELIEHALQHYGDTPDPTVHGLLSLVGQEMLRALKTGPGIMLRSGEKKVVALVGATGTGKTSTAAKLAAHFAFERGARVALVSLDTYRIAAVEQLRTYADIMGFPLFAAFSPEDYATAIEQADADLVLVDTAGRSPLNRKQLDDLRRMLEGRPDEIHLTVPATARADELRLTLAAFDDLSPDRVIVTKLDETLSLGMLYNLSRLTDAPVSYFCTGQAIPEDLHLAQPGFIRGWAETLELA